MSNNLRVAAVIVISSLYAVIRYMVFGDVKISNAPVYIVNKALSMSSAVFLFLSAFVLRKQNLDASKLYGLAFFQCACLHIILSLAILSPVYYPKFFEDGKMNVTGELMILFGALAAYVFFLLRRFIKETSRVKTYTRIGCLYLIAHLIFMGIPGWFKVQSWHGYMPPISLISGVAVLMALIVYLSMEKRGGSV